MKVSKVTEVPSSNLCQQTRSRSFLPRIAVAATAAAATRAAGVQDQHRRQPQDSANAGMQ